MTPLTLACSATTNFTVERIFDFNCFQSMHKLNWLSLYSSHSSILNESCCSWKCENKSSSRRKFREHFQDCVFEVCRSNYIQISKYHRLLNPFMMKLEKIVENFYQEEKIVWWGGGERERERVFNPIKSFPQWIFHPFLCAIEYTFLLSSFPSHIFIHNV